MKSHLLFVDFSAEALGWLILSFRWLPCLSQLSLTEPSLCARMELDSPFQRGFGSEFRSLLSESCRLGDPSEIHRGQWAGRALDTEVLYYKRRLSSLGEEEVGLGVTINPVSLPRAFTYTLFARLPLKDRFLLSFSLICQIGQGWG